MKSIFYSVIIFSCVRYVSSTCLSTGRFPNNSEPDCRGFTMCLKGAAGFMQYNLLCPENSVFSHIDSQCSNVTNYKCLPSYNCTREENIPQTSNENCTAYTSCIKDLNNIFSARLIDCPLNMVFNGSACVEKEMYQCPQITENPNTVEVIIKKFEGNFTFNSSVSWLHSHFYLVYIVIILGCNSIIKIYL